MSQLYQITARVLCHDIRLSSVMSIKVLSEEVPTQVEAETYLFKKAEAEYSEQGGYWFEFSDITIKCISN